MRAYYFSLFLFLVVSHYSVADDFVPVPAGTLRAFWLAPRASNESKTETPRFTIKAFRAMPTQVKRYEFAIFLAANPSWQKTNVDGVFADESYLKNDHNTESLKIDPNVPVTYVSWYAARAYCQWKGYRLPTVDEWEYMAAASEVKPDANGDEQFLERILQWYGQPQDKPIGNVKSIYKNLYRIWDLHGLVWEWVDDFNSAFITGESREDASPSRDKFCGAGSMNSGDRENYAAFMRFAFRSSLKGRNSAWNLGFRCVK